MGCGPSKGARSFRPTPRAARVLRGLRRARGAGAMAPCAAVSAPPDATQAQAKPLRVIILGAPASGKGTQCELIVAKCGLAHVSSGDLLRAEVEGCTAYGEAAREAVERGELAPDDVVVPIVVGRLGEEDAVAKGWLLDGFPRSAAQAGALAEAGFAPDVLILLEVPEAVLLARVSGRMLDPATGKIYHREFAPAPPEAQDRLRTRADDGAEATARKRLEVFAQHSDAVMARYADVACRVDGNRPKDAVFRDIDAAIEAARRRRA